jgi:hypothetical protein
LASGLAFALAISRERLRKDDKSTRVRVFDEGSGSLRLHSRRDDLFEFLIGAADGDGALDLKFERFVRTVIVETHDDIIHGMAVALPLNSDAGDNARPACRALVPEQMREVIGDDRVFVCKPRTAGQFGGGRFLFKCVGQGIPPRESISELAIVRASNIRAAALYLGGNWVAARDWLRG